MNEVLCGEVKRILEDKCLNTKIVKIRENTAQEKTVLKSKENP